MSGGARIARESLVQGGAARLGEHDQIGVAGEPQRGLPDPALQRFRIEGGGVFDLVALVDDAVATAGEREGDERVRLVGEHDGGALFGERASERAGEPEELAEPDEGGARVLLAIGDGRSDPIDAQIRRPAHARRLRVRAADDAHPEVLVQRERGVVGRRVAVGVGVEGHQQGGPRHGAMPARPASAATMRSAARPSP